MSYKNNPFSKISITFVILASFLILFGFPLFFNFNQAVKLFLHLSPDRSFFPFTVLVLKTSFLSFVLVGICLLFFLFWGRGILTKASERLENVKEVNFLILFLGLAFVIRMLWIILVPTQLYADWKWYDQMAYHLSQVWRYEDNGFPTAYWPIGYPLFLAIIYWIIGHSYFAVEFINVLLSLSICLFTYLIAKRLIDPLSSRLTLIIIILFPSQIFFNNVLASEILFTALLLLLIYLCLKQRFQLSIYISLIIGVLLGLLILIRAVALLLPFIIVFFYFKSNQRPGLNFRNAGLTMVMAFLTLFPWMLRNKLVLGSFTVATSGGINLYIGNGPISSGGWVWQKENPFLDLSAPNEVKNNKLGYQLAIKYILNHPLGFITRGIKKEIYLFATDCSSITKELDSAAQSYRIDPFVIFNVIGHIYYLLVLIFSAGGVFLFLKGKWQAKREFSLLLGIIIYWMGIHFIFYGVDRYHYPLIPILSIFAAGFLGAYFLSPESRFETEPIEKS